MGAEISRWCSSRRGGTYFTTVIEFNDNPPLGPAWYIVEFDLRDTGLLLEQMRDEIQRLVRLGELSPGRGNTLDVKLSGVMATESGGHVRSACGQLGAFDHQVAAFGRVGILSAAKSAWFRDRTEEVAGLLCGG